MRLARDYVSVAAVGLGGQSIDWLLSLGWDEMLKWYERGAHISGLKVKPQWEA